jgi:predicted porin
MKKALALSILAFGALAVTADAQAQSSVTLYGVVDVGVQYLTNANKAGQSQWSMASGSYLPSRFGVTGREDLGNGYAAIFTLENGFNANDGSVATSSSFFNRFAFVGIDTPAGKITLGRQGSVQYDKTVFYDPLYYGTYSQLSLNAAPITTFKVNNMVKYQSASFAGFDVDAAYGFGQQIAGSNTAGRYTGLALEYVNGALFARVLYEELRGSVTAAVDQSSLADRRVSAAAVYKGSTYTFFADYTHVMGDLHLSPDGSIYTVAAAIQATPFLRFVGEAGMYHRSFLSGTPKLFNVMAQYFLSKRTSLYAIGGYMINAGGNNYGVAYPAATSLAGQTQLGVTLGIDHRF